ncbi:MAG: TolC family protein, partial [Rhodocyclaceae bacterium]|nr:TolC family protein [Rhodocyclaceae bacterium]
MSRRLSAAARRCRWVPRLPRGAELRSTPRRAASLIALLLALLAPVLLTTGCAWKTYTPAPLDLAAADTAALERRLDDARSRALLEANGVDLRDWPAVTWSRETLLLTLLDRHPDMLAARSQAAAARAKAPAVRQPVNPDLSTRLENHSDRAGVSPWSVGAGLQFTLNQRPLLDAQGGVAEAEAAEAEVAAGEVAWRLYRALGDALLAVQSASESAALARDAVELAEARVESVGIRHRYGAAPALEVQLAGEALLAARREQATVDAALASAQAQLAQALALPPGAADALRLAAWPVLPPAGGADGEGAGPDAATARALALQNSLDLARELALYQVAEANVRLEVARQYPQLRLGPGLVWDQGDRIWQIGLALPLALLHRNQAGIAAAEARRSAQAAQTVARQNAVAGEVDTARRRVVALAGPLLAARREAEAAGRPVGLVR